MTLTLIDEIATTGASLWWRSAVIYQIYPRSFADGNGDGIGDLPGITDRLSSLAELGIDAVWLSPFFTSPQKDGGYDVADYCNVDPLFGTLSDFDVLLAEAHRLSLRVIIDIVPNHTSSEHEWFQEAFVAPAGSAARNRYIFRDGRGPGGDEPPNNWQSTFGGSAWSRHPDGQWYMHMFDSTQPDLNWRNRQVRDDFEQILRFWLDRGVDGFRVDVAHGMIKAEGLPDYYPEEFLPFVGNDPTISLAKEGPNPPYMMQAELHDIWREWRVVIDEYEGDRVLCAEAWVEPLSHLARWVRPDEMHQAFNFSYLEGGWNPSEVRDVIRRSVSAFGAVGAPSTWVLSNHDVVRHATRFGLPTNAVQGEGLGPRSTITIDAVLGLRRARAATLLMLALPGSAYLYQGEELGLPEVVQLPDDARQDPTWFRTDGQKYGRDGCRVPIPWESDAPASGFSGTGASWLPQPSDWSALSRDIQNSTPESTLNLYRSALEQRRRNLLGEGHIEWLDGYPPAVVALRVNNVVVLANMGETAVPLPAGDIIVQSAGARSSLLEPDTTVWLV